MGSAVMPEGFVLDSLPPGFVLDDQLEAQGGENDIPNTVTDIISASDTPQRRSTDTIASVIEPAATLITGAIAEPIAGIAGIAQAVNPLAEEGAGARAVEATREALTYQPRTEPGREGLEAVGEAIEPVAEVFKGAETFLGDKTFSLTGSPALAAAAATIPTAIAEALGIAAGKGAVTAAQASKKLSHQAKITKSLTEAVPSVDQLKTTARAVYNEIDNLGVSLQPKAYNGLVNKLNIVAKRQGIDPDITPKATKALQRFEARLGDSPTLSEVDTMRKVAQNAAKSIEPAEAALGATLVGTIDDFLDNIRPTALKGTETAVDIGKRYKVARTLWGRARRSELLGEAFGKARLQASGFENGIRTQFRQILNNKKQRKFFQKDELAAMRRVVQGSKKENLARLIGKLGFSEGSATQLIGGSLGVAGGAVVGGPVGAVAVPLIGQVSKKLAQRMTARNAEFADQVIRSGRSARLITKAYLKNTTKANRSAQELSELLMKPDIDFSTLPADILAQKAAQIAIQNRAALAGAVAPAGNQE
ncbi:MAG: hypothetical protein GY938_10205 [Ketobacter sp.]|nr:hypothetical protein [Ketobacter sp.]